MIVTRFRAVGWVAGVATAALSCYLVSSWVSSERAALMRVENRILAARADIRQLRTELGTRARLVQLERWNTDVLGLQAPQAGQYADGAVALVANYAAPKAPARVMQAALPAPAPVAPRVTPVLAPAAPRPALATPALAVRIPPRPTMAEPMLHRAAYLSPGVAPPPPAERSAAEPAAAPKPQRGALLGDALIGEIGRAATVEAGRVKQ